MSLSYAAATIRLYQNSAVVAFNTAGAAIQEFARFTLSAGMVSVGNSFETFGCLQRTAANPTAGSNQYLAVSVVPVGGTPSAGLNNVLFRMPFLGSTDTNLVTAGTYTTFVTSATLWQGCQREANSFGSTSQPVNVTAGTLSLPADLLLSDVDVVLYLQHTGLAANYTAFNMRNIRVNLNKLSVYQ